MTHATMTHATPSTDLAIDIHDLVKGYGSFRALDHLDMQVAACQVHGFLGPNGAGKSTTIRVLLGLLHVDSGTVRLLGGDPWADAASLHRRLAYVPGDVSLWPNLTGGEAIDLIGRARGGLDRSRRDRLIERFELDPKKKGRAYSKGNRQKVALVAALASRVDLLLLDEPTSGLDPLMEQVFTEEVRAARDAGTTVLLSSHILSEVEELCDHVSIIKAGRIVETGTLDQLRHLHRTQVTAELSDAAADEGVFADIAGVRVLEHDRERVRLEVADEAMPQVLGVLSQHRARGVTATPPSLEELFLEHYENPNDRAQNLVDAAPVPGPAPRHAQPEDDPR